MVTASLVPAHSRMRRVLTFIAVVWSVAAAFLALEAGMLELTSLVSSQPLSANLVLARQSQAGFLHCQEILNSLPPPAQDARVVQQSRYLAWRLGYILGSADASITSGIAKRPAVENALRRSLPATGALGIPSLALPRQGRSAYALVEFSGSLEEDPQCVSAALESRYSPKYAALYKFGASVGFACFYRRLAPQLNDVLAPQLRIYGSAAGVPADLYTPLLGPLPTVPGADAGQVVQSVVSRIDEYVRGNK